METLLANAGRARREVRNGREYLVAPLTLIVPGVLNGSKGPLLYPPDEIRKDYSAWNGMPLVVYHPLVNGQHVSARHPQVWETQEVGRVFNAVIDQYGKLKAEGWFDVEHTMRVDDRVVAALNAGIPIELSTGLYTDNEPAPRGANWNGRPYSHIARNYRPDHLAILPDQVGACSVNDGCGVLVNRLLANAKEDQARDEKGRFAAAQGATAEASKRTSAAVRKTKGEAADKAKAASEFAAKAAEAAKAGDHATAARDSSST
jgi:hypothetical protein